MPFERSEGVVLFRRENNSVLYLLLQYPAGHWDFVKGHIEEGESETETAVRECEEETGIKDIRIIPGFSEHVVYYFRADGKNIRKEVVFLLAETETADVVLSEEHKGYAWLTYEDAVKRSTFNNAKQILKKAHKLLD